MRLQLIGKEQNGVFYGAACCMVPIGERQVRAVAVRAGDRKQIVKIHLAVRWLINQGCNARLARQFVDQAVGEYDRQQEIAA